MKARYTKTYDYIHSIHADGLKIRLLGADEKKVKILENPIFKKVKGSVAIFFFLIMSQ